MKKTFFTAALLLSAMMLRAAEPLVSVTASPAVFPAGGSTRVSIAFTKDPGGNGVPLPNVPGGVWHTDRVSRSRNFSFVNGRQSNRLIFTLPLSSGQPGELTIPAFEVRFSDGTTARSEPVKLRVLSPGEAPPPPPGVEARIVLPGTRHEFYVGEEIPVALELDVPARMAVRSGFPRLECDGPGQAVMPDLSGSGSRHPHFAEPVEGRKEGPRGLLKTLTFRTTLSFMTPGKFTVAATGPLLTEEPRRDDGFEDPFFGGNFGLREWRRIDLKYPARQIVVVPVPPPPPGAYPLGMGGGDIGIGISAHSVRAGEALELEVKLPRSGGRIAPPALELSEFRVYPPELKTSPDGTRSIRYALIPRRGGEHTLSLGFALFDPATGKWRTAGKEFRIAVTGKVPEDPSRTNAGAPEPNGHPLLPDDGKTLSLPLAKRGIVLGVVAFAVLALAALAVELVRRSRKGGGAAARSRAVKKLVRRVKNGENPDSVLAGGGMAALARALGLPEDAPPEDVAERVGDAELASWLLRSERNAFVPEEERSECVMSEAARNKLVKLLKRALVLAACLVSFAAAGAECRGGAGCHNAGIAARRDGDLPRARLYLERAVLFAPRDGRIRAALNAVEGELGVPASRPKLRDRFRPDEYLFASGISLGAAVLAFAVLRKRRKKTAFAAALVLASAGAFLIALACSQHASGAPYGSGRAVVTERKLELSSLPAARGGRPVGTLDGGSAVVIVEERGDFIRVRSGKLDGWCRRGGAERILPPR